MRVHVELRRSLTGFIARYLKQPGFRGELIFVKAETGRFLKVSVEPKPGFPNEQPPCPELHQPVLTHVFGDEIRFSGTAIFADGVWRHQEWDVIILADPYRKSYPMPY